VPIVLGSLLPEKIIDAIAADLSDESRFLGAHGLATESMDSDEFLAEGYWRGPSWAPALMLIVHGLIDAGRVELARTIANRFCDTCVSSGFAECYNAQTGRPLHDRGYTWTASVFLILADWLNGG
jgi:glycogen debranching enzyme